MAFQAATNAPRFIRNRIIHPTTSKFNRPIRVLIDMDGVIADFEKSLTDTYKTENPDLQVLGDEHRRGLGIAEQYAHHFSIIEQNKLRDIMTRKNFFKNLPAIPKAVEQVHKLLENTQDYDCFICTSPLVHNPHCTSEKLEWIKKHFGEAFGKKVIITNDKTVVNGDFLVDDKEEITGAQVPNFTHILVRATHNQHVSGLGENEPRLILEEWEDLEDMMRLNDPRYE